jgi:eukaryotic-like serine/threonine-protein kinase
MTLTVGTKLGPYEVVAPAGAGGMGEVYRAHDSRLNREVAIKVLPAAFSGDTDRLRRFQQEAQSVAALNHPNILAIHDFGEHQGSPYLVMEYLEGDTLRARLDAGMLPVRKATELSGQITRGLAAAHDKGIVHRDLKPENIFVTRDGCVKILDFGLAKLKRTEGVSVDDPTLPSQTEPGVVMGTVGYMSPEQVCGQVADHRSDLFSFGAILYEMLFGRRAFQRATSPETMTAILKEDPPESTGSNRSIPPTLDRIVRHCLEKNPEERFQSARDVTFALGALSDTGSSAPRAVTKPTGMEWGKWLRIMGEVALLALALGLLLRRHPDSTQTSVQASILPPPGDGFWASITQPASISPDGRFLALVAMSNGQKKLWLRRLDMGEAQAIVGSDDAANPFWSPDSRYLAFFVPGKLKKLDVSGGAVSDICPSGAFGNGGDLVIERGDRVLEFGRALRRVSDKGGTPEPIPGTELARASISHLWPTFLPDGKHFLFLDWKYPTRVSQDDGVWIGSLDGQKARRLPLVATNAQYSAGYLLFSRDGDLLAQKFDLSRLELSGPVLPVARDVEYDTFFHDGMFSVSANGTLVYGTSGVGVNTVLTWFDRKGQNLGVVGQPGQMFKHRLSPDGKRVAVDIKPIDAREKIWIYDAERGTRVPLETDESGASLYSPI